MDKSLISLGLMSGTSMDGVDASIIKSDGDQKIDILCNKFKEYPNKFREKLNSYIKRIKDLEDISNNIDEYREIERELTLIHSEIANKILKIYKIKLDLVGFHGQTILHRPEKKYSIQMGDPNLLSQKIKSKVVFNFRKKDLDEGGEGAPLTPVFHQSIYKKIKLAKPVVFLNIGGVSNFTYCNRDELMAKDIGPGNVLIDEYLKKTKNINFDKDGIIASKGKIEKNLINQFLEHENYTISKHSYDRGEFDFNFVKGLKFEDAVATLTYFTAQIIADFININFKENIEIILCGGGRKNKTLIKFMEKKINSKIKMIDDFGFDGDFTESQAFAYLAIRSFYNKKISFPSTTKVKAPATGGEIFENF